jgi:response regulator RpfG family c-di-GMP phosphodiesterase
MAITDVYDALISQRPYKPPLEAEKAEHIIVAESRTHFDPFLVEVFRKVSDGFAKIAGIGGWRTEG